jgi:hypothetical protein
MVAWKRVAFFGVAFGSAFALVAAGLLAGYSWYHSRQKPWNERAIQATFDYVGTEEIPEPDWKGTPGLVFYYVLENTQDSDYRLPTPPALLVHARLKEEKAFASGSIISLGDESVFVPAKQRVRFGVHVRYPVKEDLGPDPKSYDDFRARRKRLADYAKKEFGNFDGFTLFDTVNRYQINLPNGLDNPRSR